MSMLKQFIGQQQCRKYKPVGKMKRSHGDKEIS